MIKTIVKHYLYEYAINMALDNICSNFIVLEIFAHKGDRFKWIKCTDQIGESTLTVTYFNATVQQVFGNSISIAYSHESSQLIHNGETLNNIINTPSEWYLPISLITDFLRV